jgi:hypothetical protein
MPTHKAANIGKLPHHSSLDDLLATNCTVVPAV